MNVCTKQGVTTRPSFRLLAWHICRSIPSVAMHCSAHRQMISDKPFLMKTAHIQSCQLSPVSPVTCCLSLHQSPGVHRNSCTCTSTLFSLCSMWFVRYSATANGCYRQVCVIGSTIDVGRVPCDVHVFFIEGYLAKTNYRMRQAQFLNAVKDIQKSVEAGSMSTWQVAPGLTASPQDLEDRMKYFAVTEAAGCVFSSKAFG